MRSTFRTELHDGHKGPAVIVPFDPELLWNVAPVPVKSATYGERAGHLVKGTLNGVRFESWIGKRWGKHFILVDEELQRAAKLEVGDEVDVVVSPLPATRAKAAKVKRKRKRSP